MSDDIGAVLEAVPYVDGPPATAKLAYARQ